MGTIRVMEPKINLLLIQKDLDLCALLNRTSVQKALDIHIYDSRQDLPGMIRAHEITAVMIDLDRQQKQGLALFKKIRRTDPILDIILLGQPLESDAVVDLINQGASYYLAKPLQVRDLQDILKKIIDIRALRRDTFRLEKQLEKKYSFHGLIGKSPDMLEVFALIEKIAPHFSSVLITGESGTGKELVAHAIHKLSRTKSKKFVICDCVSIPENLFESELFGYTKGAFTGADRDKRGLFEDAHEGVIFLDEIGDIPISIQAKLLRVLEQHQFRPLGSNEVREIEVKIIAATNKKLKEAISEGSFREDLYHRLNKVEIHLSRLTDRKEDIPLLVRHFLHRFSRKFSKELRGASREVQKLFMRYDWPGNVRELENVLERAAILADKEYIDLPDLPDYLQKTLPAAERLPFLDRESHPSLAELEREYIIHLLKQTKNNLRQTAKILDVARNTLYNKLKKYNIPH